MKWGTRWGDPWGNCEDSGPRFSNVELRQVSSFGQRAFRLRWTYAGGTKWGQRWGDPWGRFRGFFKVYVNGALVSTQKETTYNFTAPDGGAVVAAVVATGPLNGDVAYDPGCTAVPGNRVKLSWTRPVDDDGLSHFNIYTDAGDGSVDYSAPVAAVQAGTAASFEWTSGPLTDGTYKYVVRSVDLAGNEDTNTTEASQAIATWPASPTGLSYDYDPDTDKVTLTWSGGAQCNIYSNGGSGDIDYDTPVEMGVYSGWESDALNGPATYRYAVRAYNWVYEEKNTDYVEFELDNSADEVTRPASPFGLTVEPTADGEFVVSGWFDQRRPTIRGKKPAAAAEIRVYHDNATGTMDWNTEIGTATPVLASGGQQRWSLTTDSSAYSHGDTVQFGARAATASGAGGVLDDNTDTDNAVADDTAPGAPTGLAASAVRDAGGS